MKLPAKKVLLSVLVVFSIIFTVLGTSALAAETDTITIEASEQVTVTENEIIDNVVEETSSTDLEQVELYLEYITGFLLFFVICLLFWASYKFFKMFF